MENLMMWVMASILLLGAVWVYCYAQYKKRKASKEYYQSLKDEIYAKKEKEVKN